MTDMPPPECEQGYTDAQIRTIMGARLEEFNRWMRGQTIGYCDGRAYDHVAKAHQETGCGPHGVVTYAGDVERFLDGRPVVD